MGTWTFPPWVSSMLEDCCMKGAELLSSETNQAPHKWKISGHLSFLSYLCSVVTRKPSPTLVPKIKKPLSSQLQLPPHWAPTTEPLAGVQAGDRALVPAASPSHHPLHHCSTAEELVKLKPHSQLWTPFPGSLWQFLHLLPFSLARTKLMTDKHRIDTGKRTPCAAPGLPRPDPRSPVLCLKMSFARGCFSTGWPYCKP